MIRVGDCSSAMSRTAAHSAGSIPSRFMPESSWMPKRWPGRASTWRSIWSTEFSIGTRSRSLIMSVSPRMCPPKTFISTLGPRASRTAAPSSATATKKRRAPARASARATRPTPSP